MNDLMPSALDRQISSSGKDAFGHRHFAQALRSLIESTDHTPPFSIGLLGGWGTGKSSIKELYIHDLANDAHKIFGRTRSERIHTITFNAWRFGGKDQDVKRALLRHVFLELGGDDESLKDRLFRQITQAHEAPKGWREYTLELLQAWVRPLPAFVLTLLLLLGVLALALWLLPIKNDLARSLVAVAITWAFSYLQQHVSPPPVSAHRSLERIVFPSTTVEEYEDLLLEQIRKFKAGNACERLVVFVDDLDRLSAEEMVLGLDAVRTFMEIPESRLATGLGIVFVISCDEAKVADALARGRRRQSDLPGTVFTQSDARRYLDRIFQFRLEIPPFPRHDMRQYATQQLKDLPGIEADLRTRGVALETVVDQMVHVGVQDPRNALQIVNAFAHAWWLAKKRETAELGTDRAGGLHEGAVTNHPIALGAVCALKVNFPDFYRDLQDDPALLQRFTDVVIRRKPLEEQPRHTQQLLVERYLQDNKEAPGASSDVRPEHRPLRQFLASLVGLRWPDSLRSLVLLSEDPVTRKFGAKAPRIFEALVSGDTQGVLEGLGRHTDTTPLRPDEALLLRQMAEELRLESPSRRTNASRVIADLVDRLPITIAHLLLGTLCRELGDSLDLRSQLGIPKLRKVLAAAPPEDRRAVASRLIDDVLTVDQDIRFRLETMEPPSLDEAIGFAHETLALALPIRRDHGLDPSSDAHLIAWLATRIVRAAAKTHQLPFRELHGWLDAHEDHLLPALAHVYPDLLASELAGEDSPDLQVTVAVSRAAKLFTTFWDAGEDSRPSLWKHLTRYVALRQVEATRAAWETMTRHVSAPTPTEVSHFVEAFARRLEKAQEEEWALDPEPFNAATEALFTIVRTRLADLAKGALVALSDLAILWSADDETAKLSSDLLSELLRGKSTEAQRVLDDWAPRLLNDLPTECGSLLGTLFPTLSDPTKAAITGPFQSSIVAAANVDEATATRYRAFVEAVPSAGWGVASLKSHLDQLLAQVAVRHNNPNQYLSRLFPPVSRLLRYASPGPLGQMLHTLFTQAKGQPTHFAWLHAWMAGQWPQPSPQLKPYDPQQIFRDARDFAVTYPQSSSKGLLASLRDLLTRELVPAAEKTPLIDAACATWKAKPDDAIETFEAAFADLTPEQTAALLDAIDWTKEDHLALLSRAWLAVGHNQEPSTRVASTNRILERGLSGPDDEPDRGLRVWLETQNEARPQLLNNVLVQDSLNDAHRRRAWQQAIRIADQLGPSFFLAVVPQILALSSIGETADAIFADGDRVSEVLGSTDARAELSQELMALFSQATTNTVKAGIAAWSKKLSGQAHLRKLRPEVLTDDDMSILHSQFPGASTLKEIDKARKKLADAR